MEERPAPHRRYADAVLFAMNKHRGQNRDTGEPFIIHPLRVSETLRTIGGVHDLDVLCAAILHDLIEETDCDHDALARRFGDRTAGLVSELSGDMRLPKKERRREALERIARGSVEARAIKLADRLDNLTDMGAWATSRRRVYLHHSRELLDACEGASPPLEQALGTALDEQERLLAAEEGARGGKAGNAEATEAV